MGKVFKLRLTTVLDKETNDLAHIVWTCHVIVVQVINDFSCSKHSQVNQNS